MAKTHCFQVSSTYGRKHLREDNIPKQHYDRGLVISTRKQKQRYLSRNLRVEFKIIKSDHFSLIFLLRHGFCC